MIVKVEKFSSVNVADQKYNHGLNLAKKHAVRRHYFAE
jgi:hypothetical protein